MRAKAIRVLLMNLILLLPSVVLADSGGNGDANSAWPTFLINAAPYVLFIVLFYFFFVRQMKSAAPRYEQHQRRHEQHMERIEALLERLVVALEQKDKP